MTTSHYDRCWRCGVAIGNFDAATWEPRFGYRHAACPALRFASMREVLIALALAGGVIAVLGNLATVLRLVFQVHP